MSWENNYNQFKSTSALSGTSAGEKREQVFKSFLDTGLPTKKDEAWKYTSLSEFKAIEWKLPDDEVMLTHEQMQEVSKLLPSNFQNYVFVNGILNRTLSDDSDDLIEITPLEDSDFEFSKETVEDRLVNLSMAFLSKKIKISVAKQKVIEKPVQVLFVHSSVHSVFQSDRLNIHLQENSEMKLIINSISFINSSAGAINLNVNVRLENSARMSFVQLQNENTESFHFSQCQFNLGSAAQLTTLALSLGNKLTRNYFELKFNGENAMASVFGLGLLDKDQHVDNYTFLQHEVGNNESVQHYKSILAGSAHSAFRGRVLIAKNAQKARSQQLNNNLLLTRTSHADSVPQLEIFADDVKAGHGATFGQLNKDEIFYFLTRGINQYQAVKMLSYGFAKEMIYRLDSEMLQNYLLEALNKKLDSMVQNG